MSASFAPLAISCSIMSAQRSQNRIAQAPYGSLLFSTALFQPASSISFILPPFPYLIEKRIRNQRTPFAMPQLVDKELCLIRRIEAFRELLPRSVHDERHVVISKRGVICVVCRVRRIALSRELKAFNGFHRITSVSCVSAENPWRRLLG